MKKLIILLIVFVVAGCGIKSQLKKLPIVSGYSAKKLCSYTFISELDPAKVEAEDLTMFPLPLATNRVNYDNKSVTSTVLGLGKKTAIYKQDLGCVLLYGEDDHQLTFDIENQQGDASKVFPYGDKVTAKKPLGVNYMKVDKAKFRPTAWLRYNCSQPEHVALVRQTAKEQADDYNF